MRATRSSAWQTALVLLVSAAIGLFLADQVNRELGISFAERPLPEETPPAAEPAPPLPPLAPIQAIVLPPGGTESDLYRIATAELVQAIALRTGSVPRVVEPGEAAGATRSVIVAPPEATGEREAFHLRADDRAITIRAGTLLASVYGMAYLTEQLLAGIGDEALFSLNGYVRPALGERFVDLGGVGVVPDSAAWAARDYSHHNRAFQQVVLAEPPYINRAAFAEVGEQMRAYVQRMASYGYNGIVFKGLLEYVNFDRVGSGFEVYAAGSEYRERHLAMRAAFGELFRYTHEQGMRVILSTDMLALTAPLEAYLERRFGRVDVADPELWEVYRLGLEELFEEMPHVDGVMIRIGETGAVFNLEGWNYYSELHVKTVPAVQAMLTTLSRVAAAHDRTLYFRTWSVGVGETGGMHTRPEVYARILDDVDEPNLVVSTKYTAGDFYSYLPLNPTLFGGEEPRIVEFQTRREYEGFGSFPNYLGSLHQSALQQIRSANPQVQGVWVWTQEGGPPRVSPLSLYPFHGFWQLIDADVYVAARLAWDPDADLAALTRAWVRRTFGDDPQVVENLTEMMFLSREAVLQGLYLGPFARRQVRALGLEPPPMMWIFEWDIVTGSSAALSTVYYHSRENVEAAIAEGFAAVESVRRMQALLQATDRSRFTQPELHDRLAASLAYQEDLLLTLALYRQAFLNYYRWLDTGERRAREEWRAAKGRLAVQEAAHVARYGQDLDFRAYSFVDADVGMAHAARSGVTTWLARLLLLLSLGTLALGVLVSSRSSLDPVLTARPSDLLAVSAWPLLLIGLTVLTFSSFLSLGLPLLVAVGLGSYLVALFLQVRGRPHLPLWAATSGGLLLMAVVPLAVLAVRGPGYYWYQFWTSSGFHWIVVTAGTVAAGWFLYATFATLRTAYRYDRAQAAGRLLIALGAPLLAVAALLQVVGLERAITGLNNEIGILPMGLSVTLGITTHLNIPTTLPLLVATLGALLLFVGLMLRLFGDRRAEQDARSDAGAGGTIPAGARSSGPSEPALPVG